MLKKCPILLQIMVINTLNMKNPNFYESNLDKSSKHLKIIDIFVVERLVWQKLTKTWTKIIIHSKEIDKKSRKVHVITVKSY